MPWRQEKVAVLPHDADLDSAAIAQRQDEIIKSCMAELTADRERRPIASACIFIYPSGEVRTKVVGLEPEHVAAVLQCFETMAARMQEFLNDAISSGNVVQIKRQP